MGCISILLSDAIIIAIIGLAGTVFTGGFLKYFDYKLNKMRHSFDQQVQIRSIFDEDIDDLKKELEDRKEEIRLLEESLDEWKHKYYELMETLLRLKKQLNLGIE